MLFDTVGLATRTASDHSQYNMHPIQRFSFGAGWLVGWSEFNVPFQHKYGYIRDDFGAGKKQNKWWQMQISLDDVSATHLIRMQSQSLS